MKGFLYRLPGYVMILGFLFGLVAVVFVPYEMYRKAQAESWPARKGVVTLGYDRGSRGKRGAIFVVPEICGRYRDNGERFCVTRVRFGAIRWGSGEAQAQEILRRYPVGSEVDVHHAPDNPKETVLEARSPWVELQVLLGAGLFFLALPVVLHVLKKKGVLK